MLREHIRYIREIQQHPANREHKLRALGRYLRWNVGRRLLSEADYAISILPNCVVILSNRENYATNAYCCGLYDFEDMSFLLHVLRPGDVFGDFGANVGIYSSLAASTGANVFAVEPVPDTYQRLRRNLRLQDAKGDAFNCGLGEETATLRFTTDRGGMNKVTNKIDSHTCEVAVCRADELAARTGLFPVFLKVDVEGWELPVFKGAEALLRDNVKAIVVEMNESGREFGFTDAAVNECLQDHGFRFFSYAPHERVLTPAAGINREGFNTLYIKDSAVDWAMERVKSATPVPLSYGAV